MLKKNYFYLSLAAMATVYNAIQLILYPESTPIWFIRIMGGFFILLAIGYILDIQKIYLQNKIDNLKKLISDKKYKNEG